MLPHGGQGMLKQIFVTAPIDRKTAGGAPALLRIALVACAVSLAGCVTSSDEVGTGPPEFQSGPVASAPKAIAGPDASSAPKVARASPTKASGYTVGPLDVLEISVFKVPDLSKSVQVADTG